jgi:MFS transporter, PPP family, 3-phenylpropionic acid transporter
LLFGTEAIETIQRRIAGIMTFNIYWRLAGFYFTYFAFVAAYSSYWGLYLQSLGFAAAQIGTLMAVQQVTRIFAPTFWGALSDRIGRPDWVIKFTTVAALLVFAAVFIDSGFLWLMLVMSVAGFFWSGPLPLVEVTTLRQLGGATGQYGRIRLWGSVGFIVVVSGIGVLLDYIDVMRLPMLILPLMLALLVFAWLVPGGVAPSHGEEQGSIMAILRRPQVMVFLAACFLMTLAHGPLYVFFSIYLVDRGYSKTSVGMLWSVGVIVEILVFLYFARIQRYFSVPRIFLFCFLVAAVRFLLIAWGVRWFALLFFAQMLHALTFGAFHVIAMGFVHRYFSGRHQAKGQALFSGLTYGAGSMLGGLLSGFIWEPLGPGITFSLAALSAFAGFVLLWWKRPFAEN